MTTSLGGGRVGDLKLTAPGSRRAGIEADCHLRSTDSGHKTHPAPGVLLDSTVWASEAVPVPERTPARQPGGSRGKCTSATGRQPGAVSPAGREELREEMEERALQDSEVEGRGGWAPCGHVVPVSLSWPCCVCTAGGRSLRLPAQPGRPGLGACVSQQEAEWISRAPWNHPGQLSLCGWALLASCHRSLSLLRSRLPQLGHAAATWGPSAVVTPSLHPSPSPWSEVTRHRGLLKPPGGPGQASLHSSSSGRTAWWAGVTSDWTGQLTRTLVGS